MSMSAPQILQLMPMPAKPSEDLEANFEIHRLWQAADRDQLIERVAASTRGLVTNGHIGASAQLMDRLPKLEMIGCFGVGVDAVDLEAARERGLRVSNTPDVLTDAVAELALGLLIDVARRVSANERYLRAGRWVKEGDPKLAHTLAGRTAGIVGLGRIGLATARLCEAFGMRVVYQGPRQKADVAYPYYADLVEMARAVDALMITCVGASSTRGLITAEVIEALGPDGWLINVSRGFVVDEAALVDALVAGRLGAAGLDVFLKEPHVPEALLDLDNVVLQPHQASATVETRDAMGQLVVDNLKAYFAGRPLLTPVV
jgi:lactate dehydrogenase-like 2-hydroxyacid dehydrogenase